MRRSGIQKLCVLTLVLFAAMTQQTFADVITFESFTGPATFVAAGNAQTLTILTSIGNVVIQGGVILTNTAFLPADQTSIYGTAGNAADIGVITGMGFTNPLTITFPVPITNFFLDVLNGNTIDVNYQVADNNGNGANFLLVPNLSSGQKTIGFAATGNIITIAATTGQSTPTGLTWDFFVDTLHFNEPLPPNLNPIPEPSTLLLTATCLAGLMLGGRRRKSNAD